MQLNNNCTMYLREISNVLAIACIFRKENLINQARRKKLSVNLNDLCTLVIETSLLVKVGSRVGGKEIGKAYGI